MDDSKKKRDDSQEKGDGPESSSQQELGTCPSEMASESEALSHEQKPSLKDDSQKVEETLFVKEEEVVSGEEIRPVVKISEVISGEEIRPVVKISEVISGEEIRPVVEISEVVSREEIKPVAEVSGEKIKPVVEISDVVSGVEIKPVVEISEVVSREEVKPVVEISEVVSSEEVKPVVEISEVVSSEEVKPVVEISEVVSREEVKPVVEISEVVSGEEIKPVVGISEVLELSHQEGSDEKDLAKGPAKSTTLQAEHSLRSGVGKQELRPATSGKSKGKKRKKKSSEGAEREETSAQEDKSATAETSSISTAATVHEPQESIAITPDMLSKVLQRIGKTKHYQMALEDQPSRLKRLYKDKLYTDITFHVVEGSISRTFEAHKCFLSVCSPVLETVFKEHPGVSIITFRDMNPTVFGHMLNFFYTSELACSATCDLLLTFDIAEKFIITTLKRKCQEQLTKISSSENVLAMLNEAVTRKILSTKTKCLKVIQQLRNFHELLVDKTWLTEPAVIEILKCPVLAISSETDILQFIIGRAGAKRTVDNDPSYNVTGLLPYIRYDGLTAQEFLSVPKIEKEYTTQQIIDVLLYIARGYKELPSWSAQCSAGSSKKCVESTSKETMTANTHTSQEIDNSASLEHQKELGDSPSRELVQDAYNPEADAATSNQGPIVKICSEKLKLLPLNENICVKSVLGIDSVLHVECTGERILILGIRLTWLSESHDPYTVQCSTAVSVNATVVKKYSTSYQKTSKKHNAPLITCNPPIHLQRGYEVLFRAHLTFNNDQSELTVGTHSSPHPTGKFLGISWSSDDDEALISEVYFTRDFGYYE